MLNKKLKSSLQGTLPSGITFTGDDTLWVKKSKNFVSNGEKKCKTLTHTIRLGITPDMDIGSARNQFEKRLKEALTIKSEMTTRLSSRKFLEAEQSIKMEDNSLTALFNAMLGSVYRNCSDKHLKLVKQYFQDTMDFFEHQGIKNPTIEDLHREEWQLIEFKHGLHRSKLLLLTLTEMEFFN